MKPDTATPGMENNTENTGQLPDQSTARSQQTNNPDLNDRLVDNDSICGESRAKRSLMACVSVIPKEGSARPSFGMTRGDPPIFVHPQNSCTLT